MSTRCDQPLLQLGAHLADGGVRQRVGLGAGQAGGEDRFGGLGGEIHRGGLHVGGGLRLGLGDLALGHLGAALDLLLELFLGFLGQTLGVGLGGFQHGRGLALGLYVSFSGILTFKNSTALRDIARAVPMDRLLVETDAPYLAPGKYRGKRNEPSFVTETARVLAETRGVSVDEIARQTTENFFRLFDKVPRPDAKAA